MSTLCPSDDFLEPSWTPNSSHFVHTSIEVSSTNGQGHYLTMSENCFPDLDHVDKGLLAPPVSDINKAAWSCLPA